MTFIKNKNTLILLIMGAVTVFYGGKYMSKPKLKYFKASEFGLWYPMMNNDLLMKLDKFRELWGDIVVISPVVGGLGRHGGEDNTSQHNVDKWGEVLAVDVFPTGMDNISERRRAFAIAKSVGFTGIGLYTDTKPSNLLHVDVRKADKLATWARVNGEYVGINQVV